MGFLRVLGFVVLMKSENSFAFHIKIDDHFDYPIHNPKFKKNK